MWRLHPVTWRRKGSRFKLWEPAAVGMGRRDGLTGLGSSCSTGIQEVRRDTLA